MLFTFNYNIIEKNRLEHIPNHLEYPARNCYEAACYRNILPAEELKSIIFQNDNHPFAVHLLGDCKVEANHLPLASNGLKLFDLSPFKNKGLEKGTVNPFTINNILNLKTIFICKSIFKQTKIYTNDGTLFGTIAFSPALLLEIHPNSRIGNFSSKL